MDSPSGWVSIAMQGEEFNAVLGFCYRSLGLIMSILNKKIDLKCALTSLILKE